jgi:hypothetical protein
LNLCRDFFICTSSNHTAAIFPQAELRTLRAAKAAALIEKQEIAAAKVEAAMNKVRTRFLMQRSFSQEKKYPTVQTWG